MEATLYIIQDMDAIRFGRDPAVRLWEPEGLSREWIRRVTVELPEGFEIAKNTCEEYDIYSGKEHYELSTDKDENPVIIDHIHNGAYIRLPILSEGWDE